MKTHLKLLTLALALAGAGQTLLAQTTVPNLITYQGRVNVGGQPFTGTGQFKFALVSGGTHSSRQAMAFVFHPGGIIQSVTVFDGGAGYATSPSVTFVGMGMTGSGASGTATVSGGVVIGVSVDNAGSGYAPPINITIAPPPAALGYATYWSHDNTSASGSQPTSAVNLPVANGLFMVPLGDTNQANMAALPANVATNDSVHLRIWFNDGTNGFAQLTPDQPLTAAPYALVAQRAAQLEGTSTGPVTLNNAANSFSGNGAGLTSVNATTLGGLSATNFWKLGGNAGTTTSNFLGTTDNQPLELKVNNQRGLRLEPTADAPNVIGGYSGNFASNGVVGAFIGGGGTGISPNIVGGNYASVLGGYGNTASGIVSTAMGYDTYAIGNVSTAMGFATYASGDSSTAMGVEAEASGYASTAMGFETSATNYYSTAMGFRSRANGNTSTAMGSYTTASGNSSTAMGYQAKAMHDGTFVWAGGNIYDFPSFTTNRAQFYAQNGLSVDYFSQRNDGGGTKWILLGAEGQFPGQCIATYTTAYLSSGGAWVSVSDRNLKTNFTTVNAQDVLNRLCRLPVTAWNYRTEGDGIRHLGPMAQDFSAAFGLNGSDDKHIASVDESGVAFAAIQGLNQKLEQKETEITELKARLEKLEQMLIGK